MTIGALKYVILG